MHLFSHLFLKPDVLEKTDTDCQESKILNTSMMKYQLIFWSVLPVVSEINSKKLAFKQHCWYFLIKLLFKHCAINCGGKSTFYRYLPNIL